MCDKCNGVGSIGITTPGDGIKRPIGDGLTVERGASYSTALCECRRSLPRRHGEVRWWTFDTPYSESLDVGGIDFCHIAVTITPELPESEDGYPLHRTEANSHFVPRLEVTIDGDPLTSDWLRDMAAFLVRMADKVDEMDKPIPTPSNSKGEAA